MKRIIDKKLDDWYSNENKKPLIIKGSRQVGKTYSVRKFAKRNYENLIEINFERELEHVELFKTTRNPREILDYLKLSYLNFPFDKSTLLFLDEIQASPDVLTTLKFLAEDFPLDIVCSGSVLGVAISSTPSFPVGYVEIWDMRPLTFIEYLWAFGIDQGIIDILNSALVNKMPLQESLHEKINRIFEDYLIVGGMPEAVSSYLKNKNYCDSLNVQRRIVKDYTHDMAKYASGSDRIKARECYESIPLQLAKENKKFQYSLVKKGYSARYYDSSLKWLEDSGLIIKVNRLSHIKSPIEAYVELPVFKAYESDTGLLISQFDEKLIIDLLSGKLGSYKRAIFENIVAQMINSRGKKAYYYEPNQYAEIDFIINYEAEVTPIEVKSSKNTQSRSFLNFIKKNKPNLSCCISMKNIGYDGELNIIYIPFYLFELWLNNERDILII